MHLCLYAWVIPVSAPGWIILAIVAAPLWSLPFFLYTRWPSRTGIAALWVTVEGIRAFLGWGWLPLAASVTTCPLLLNWARLGGETLVGFILVYAALFIASAGKTMASCGGAHATSTPCPRLQGGEYIGGGAPIPPTGRTNAIAKYYRVPFLRAAGMALLIVSGGILLGELPAHSSGKIEVGLVQPNAPTRETYTDEDNQQEAAVLHELSMNMHQARPDLVFWPEEALSWSPINTDTFLQLWTEAGAAALKTPIITGALWHEETQYYNAVALVDPSSGLSPPPYKKRRLVPFGEYIPFAQFSWMRSLTPIVDSFAAGERAVILKASTKSGSIRIWPLICYEDTFDSLSDHAGNKSDILAVFINDGWFYPQAQSQHAAHSVLRAVEQGIPLLRVSNSGLSGVVTPEGSSHYLPSDRRLGEIMEVPLRHIDTPYSHSGSWWRRGGVLLLICYAGTTLLSRVMLLAKKQKT